MALWSQGIRARCSAGLVRRSKCVETNCDVTSGRNDAAVGSRRRRGGVATTPRSGRRGGVVSTPRRGRADAAEGLCRRRGGVVPTPRRGCVDAAEGTQNLFASRVEVQRRGSSVDAPQRLNFSTGAKTTRAPRLRQARRRRIPRRMSPPYRPSRPLARPYPPHRRRPSRRRAAFSTKKRRCSASRSFRLTKT